MLSRDKSRMKIIPVADHRGNHMQDNGLLNSILIIAFENCREPTNTHTASVERVPGHGNGAQRHTMKSKDKSENRINDTGRDKVRSKCFANETKRNAQQHRTQLWFTFVATHRCSYSNSNPALRFVFHYIISANTNTNTRTNNEGGIERTNKFICLNYTTIFSVHIFYL